ncbi:hypothetical protein [Jeotgalibacillus haloalkalitolerans]|uniref:Uncharacterized protein n=1 Tax=Jeotgalibacillus haloalkalitolerans TaxID=3104292 RepID=A0ABU5KPN0_9BACL|nr:hypothetical protein [Jeotgalibacillus sp. HH7-29]MDZ5712665.1 hypothetical protein [Jeotgalibacillus sp. HH7-29]
MDFKYQSPFIGRTEKPVIISHEHREIGQIKRYFKNTSSTTRYDVNMTIEEFQTGDIYRIDQTGFKLTRGAEWQVFKNDQPIGHIKTPEGIFKTDQIDISIEGQPEITFKAKLFGSVKIIGNQQTDIGFTKSPAGLKRVYEGQIDEAYLNIPLILFYSLVHTFWCAFD